MESITCEIDQVLLIKPTRHGDERGYFFELWNGTRYEELGLPAEFVQDNVSYSQRDVLRGLHYQWPQPQGKLVTVLAGAVFDVAVDVRRSSPTFGKWVGRTLSAQNGYQLYIPPGFAHGFVVTSETAVFSYKCTDYYASEHEYSIRWNDPAIGIDWPVASPALSVKDAGAPTLKELMDHLPP